MLAASDVLGTGGFGAVAAQAGPPKTVAVVGDGAVGLLGVLAASQLGAEPIIAMSRHQPRQQPAVEFGATDIVTDRGDAGWHSSSSSPAGWGALGHRGGRHPESMLQAIGSTRPGGHVGYVGVAHGSPCPARSCASPPAPARRPHPGRRFLPELIDLICNHQIDPARSSTSASHWPRPPRATRP